MKTIVIAFLMMGNAQAADLKIPVKKQVQLPCFETTSDKVPAGAKVFIDQTCKSGLRWKLQK